MEVAVEEARVRTVEPVDEILPARSMLTLGLQHVLVIYAGVVAVPLILGGALGLEQSQIVVLINCNLIIGGLATLLQTLGIWRFGARLPLIQGASFIALAPMMQIGEQYGLTHVFGSVMVAGALAIGLAPLFSRLLRFFPRVVIGCLITTVGISLMPAAAGWLGGGVGSESFGAPEHLLVGLLTVVVTVVVYVGFRGLMSSLSVLVGMAVGTVVAMLIGLSDFSGLADAAWIGIAAPLTFGPPQFSLVPILIMTLAMIVIMAETTGNTLAIGRMVETPISPRRLGNAFRGEGLATMLSALFNGFPLNAFSQNTGLIAMTRVRSRYVVAAAGVIMILMGLVPKVGAIVAAIPPSVLGGGAIVMFGMTTAAGIQELARVKYEGTHNALIVAISLSVGVLPMAMPELLEEISGPLALILESGIFLCAIVAVVLNAAINRSVDRDEDSADAADMSSDPPATSSQPSATSSHPSATSSGVTTDREKLMKDHQNSAMPIDGTNGAAEAIGLAEVTDSECVPESERTGDAVLDRGVSADDLARLRETIALADDAKNRGRHPFASIVVSADGRVLASKGNNSMPPEGDPTQHAELSAAAEAARTQSVEELASATLYTSAEPCVMCTGAVYWTGIGRIVYALSESRLLALTGDDPENPTFDLPCREVITRGQREIEVVGPLLEDEAAEAHHGFWTRQSS
ncbi:xanthine permease [Brevibacterium sanguinis]|uniref:Xanthine permease n=2 Tax=Brevibacterium TaxID=1696 RepID=A0A366IJD7_9MICO|nr:MULTISPECIES: solute carrier family 23 protein [Brevibacterium]RBP65627.1 xanthine permease [Brevibacterium sanguinis]RBP72261.1 xanthine permease [Brevibacterium celere]